MTRAALFWLAVPLAFIAGFFWRLLLGVSLLLLAAVVAVCQLFGAYAPPRQERSDDE